MYRYILGAHVIASSLPPFLTLPPSLFAHSSLPSCLPLRLAPSCRLGLPARAALRVQHVLIEHCVNSKTYKRDGFLYVLLYEYTLFRSPVLIDGELL